LILTAPSELFFLRILLCLLVEGMAAQGKKAGSLAGVDLSHLVAQFVAKEEAEEKLSEYERLTLKLEQKEEKLRLAEIKSKQAEERFLQELETEEELKRKEKKKKDKQRRRRKRKGMQAII